MLTNGKPAIYLMLTNGKPAIYLMLTYSKSKTKQKKIGLFTYFLFNYVT